MMAGLLDWASYAGGFMGIVALAVAFGALFAPRDCACPCRRDLARYDETRRTGRGARRATAGQRG
ncbi:hypothetical protein [Nonomuraea rubra]|uniref:hypothetical protein n=1 Tax=Nonomuraea rubra TaxID=46180 RepID=UPI0033FB2D45